MTSLFRVINWRKINFLQKDLLTQRRIVLMSRFDIFYSSVNEILFKNGFIEIHFRLSIQQNYKKNKIKIHNYVCHNLYKYMHFI